MKKQDHLPIPLAAQGRERGKELDMIVTFILSFILMASLFLLIWTVGAAIVGLLVVLIF